MPKYSKRVYGFHHPTLSKTYTLEQLIELQEEIKAHPKNKNPDTRSAWMFTPEARRELDALAYAIVDRSKQDKNQHEKT